ncbi:MAG: recombination mediator RecR [Bacteroidia bacterium]|nr:recombination mediator RecR [Bacteroidia bacterium]
MQHSSLLVQETVNNFTELPGIGPKSALRLVLYLLKSDPEYAKKLGSSIIELRDKIKSCKICHNISDDEVCSICNDSRREEHVLCVVENLRDLMAIEDTRQFRGRYHILGGVISPIEGVGPEELHIDSLLERIERNGVQEIIMAISPTIDGDTTIFYISKLLEGKEITISTIARGVSFGGALEYTDEITLGRSIISRIPYNS